MENVINGRGEKMNNCEALGLPQGSVRALILIALTGALIYMAITGSTEAQTALITMAVTSLNSYLNKGDAQKNLTVSDQPGQKKGE